MISWTTSLMMSQLVFGPSHCPVSAPLALQELEQVLQLTAALQRKVCAWGREESCDCRRSYDSRSYDGTGGWWCGTDHTDQLEGKSHLVSDRIVLPTSENQVDGWKPTDMK